MSHNLDTTSEGALERAPSLVDEIAEKILARVMSGELEIGAHLRQEALAKEFNVSRTPIREALRQLQANGIAEVVPNRGTIIRAPSPLDLREAYLVRSELEGLAAELAAQWIRDDELECLREAKKLFRRSEAKLEDWVRANDSFHQTIQQASRNKQLMKTIIELHQKFPRSLTWAALNEDSHLFRKNVVEHNEIFQALERREAIMARQLMAQHVRNSGEHVAMWFERQSRDTARNYET